MALLQDLDETIKKHLPEQVGKTLKKELEAKAQLEVTNTRLTKELASYKKDLANAQAELGFHATLETRRAEVAAREEKVAEDERDFRVKAMEVRLEEAEKRADMAKGFAFSLTANRIIREKTQQNIPIYEPMWSTRYDANGNAYQEQTGGCVYPHPETKDVTKEEG